MPNSSGEKIIKVNEVDICVESFGKVTDPPILLIMGAAASMIWWDEDFCRKLAREGRYVIRFDNRDVGRSTSYEPGTINYTVDDMVEDSVGVLDHFNIKDAHIAGMSLGGMLAQLIAIKYPDRVQSLTIISSSIWDDRPDLPPISIKVLEHHMKAAEVDWQNKDSAIRFMVEGWKLLNGSKHPFDEEQAVKLATTEYERAKSVLSSSNHSLLTGGESYYGKVKEIQAPILIIHGTEDPVLPYEHAEALRQELPEAKLLRLEGRGHEIHKNDWEEIISAIIQHSR